MNNINNLKILIVALTTVLALTNFGKEEFRKEILNCYHLSENISSDLKNKT
ncbi:hypothetical protein [Flavobacterium pectinovorum]|jgi:hypothetical protein|uniref:hypothetical protein n=1 Tax=Flavobacterium pectinovorum TaxID=29533 RepID=UPI001375CA04|nr:hypothetical protein [Flavobacterium pectinovorum]